MRLILLLFTLTATAAQAGLFSDDEVRKQVQQLENRVQQLEKHVQQLETRIPQFENSLQKLDQKLDEANKQQTRSMLDLQGQIDAVNVELRKLRGLSEELARGIQDAEKREKDFYVDLDTRLRRFETLSNAAQSGANPSVATAPVDLNDPTAENRAFEAAYGLFKGGSYASAVSAFQNFLTKYPNSVHVVNASYWLGSALFALNDFSGALLTYQNLLKNFSTMPKAADVMFDIARCQQELKQGPNAQKTLKQLISKYPASDAAAKAKKLLDTIK